MDSEVPELVVVEDPAENVEVNSQDSEVFWTQRIMMNVAEREFQKFLERKRVSKEESEIVLDIDKGNSMVILKYQTYDGQTINLDELNDLRDRIQKSHDCPFQIGEVSLYGYGESSEEQQTFSLGYSFDAGELAIKFWREYGEEPEFIDYRDDEKKYDKDEMSLPNKLGLTSRSYITL